MSAIAYRDGDDFMVAGYPVPRTVYETVTNLLMDLDQHVLLYELDVSVSPFARCAIAERVRQVRVEGYDEDHDHAHTPGELIAAARSYIQAYAVSYGMVLVARGRPEMPSPPIGEVLETLGPDDEWPWDHDAYKPSPDPLRNLEKAVALMIAEGDRYVRTEAE